jgi:hypothetical protein
MDGLTPFRQRAHENFHIKRSWKAGAPSANEQMKVFQYFRRLGVPEKTFTLNRRQLPEGNATKKRVNVNDTDEILA